MNLKERLEQEMETRGITQSSIARSLNVSAATLSQWLKGEYNGNVANIDKKVKAWLEVEAERRHSPNTIPFRLTHNAKKVFEVARICHVDKEIGVITGEAGLGKTVALREYTRRYDDDILIEADHGYTAKTLFQELCQRAGLEPGRQLHPMLEAVVEKLSGTHRMVIVDEAEHLPYRALELLRRLHDKANIGLLLVGMPILYGNIKGKKIDFAQLYSRVGLYTNLQKLSTKDVELLVTAVYPHANGLTKDFSKNANGNARRLSKLMSRAERVAQVNDVPLSAEVIESATSMLIA